MIEHTVAVSVGATDVPYNITSDLNFQRMIRALDLKYCISWRTLLMSLIIDDIIAKMRSQIQISMAAAKKLISAPKYDPKKD